MNVNCSSSEDNLGLQRLPWGHSWEFKFRVNWKSTTKFNCDFTWYKGGSHKFTIFRNSRDNGMPMPCRVCIWEVVGKENEKPICRKRRDHGPDWCFDWEI